MLNYSMMMNPMMYSGMGMGVDNGNVHMNFKAKYGVGPDLMNGPYADTFECAYTPRNALPKEKYERNPFKRLFNTWFK